MKRLLPFLTIFGILLAWFSLQMVQEPAEARASGSPNNGGNTGSPLDGTSCAKSGCHSDQNAIQNSSEVSINTDIPSSGYIPGQTYTITAEILAVGNNKFGFELTAENDASNSKVGDFSVTNTETQFTNDSNAVTHTSSGSGSKTWQMDWQAPSAGTGDVTFYASFNVANNNLNSSGDTIHLTNTTISEDTSSTAIPSAHMMDRSVSVHPVPANERITIRGMTDELGKGKVLLRDLKGRVVQELGELERDPSSERSFSLDADLSSGTYLMEIHGQESRELRKILIE